ncbi:protein Abitram [Anthonomus grandis grandis]|uniref:protein Abitram n=1 Tax=Anthonomus grandis grandis TaxID=2921223 RepID=UPI00216608B5|nr:protein Abitram [Anthonomus grandis grandis]
MDPLDSEDQIVAKKIKQLSVPILQSITREEIDNFEPYHERYYENKYCTAFNTPRKRHDTILRFHSNKLILISIAEGHDIFRNKKVIEKIDFTVNQVDRLNINVSGKKKTGAKTLKRGAVLCYLKCRGEDEPYPVYCALTSKLIEVNQLVVRDPQLLVKSYRELGYIAVLNPSRFGPQKYVESNSELLCEEEYKKSLCSVCF